jgi:hypothetical protein
MKNAYSKAFIAIVGLHQLRLVQVMYSLATL